MTIATFDAAAFKLRYPEFSLVSDVVLSYYFLEAGLYLSNDDNSPVQNVSRRTVLLFMLTAHLASVNGCLSADNSPNPAGRVSQATEGSVSVSMDYLPPGSHSWFTQSQYGASFWQATNSLRAFRYISQPTIY